MNLNVKLSSNPSGRMFPAALRGKESLADIASHWRPKSPTRPYGEIRCA
jgi:hypothetical protein